MQGGQLRNDQHAKGELEKEQTGIACDENPRGRKIKHTDKGYRQVGNESAPLLITTTPSFVIQ
jgi:hypothetical protein